MAASKLGLYNSALREIGDTRLASLTEANVSRRTLDDVYSESLLYCLEQGQWNFAMRAQEITPSTDITPAFGYANAFVKPDDWVRTAAVCADEYYRTPLTDCADEVGVWYADIDPLYVKYVSNDVAFGLDLSLWPGTFTRYVELYLARKICKSISNSTTDVEALDRALKKAKSDAMSKDAMNEGTKFPAPGMWVQSRGRRFARPNYRA